MRFEYLDVPVARKSTVPGEVTCLDGWGPYPTPAVGTNAVYLTTAVDEASNYPWVQQAIAHTAKVWLEFIDDIDKNRVTYTTHRPEVMRVRTDNAGELAATCLEWADGLKSRNKIMEHTPPYEKGGTAQIENLLGVLVPMARQLMARAPNQVNKSFFLHAIVHGSTILRAKASRGKEKTRYHIYMQRPFDVSHLKVFGAFGWARIDPVRRDTKAGPTAEKCVYIGQAKGGFLVVIGKGAAAQIKVTNQARFYEANLIHVGVMPRAVLVDKECQATSEETSTPGPAALSTHVTPGRPSSL